LQIFSVSAGLAVPENTFNVSIICPNNRSLSNGGFKRDKYEKRRRF